MQHIGVDWPHLLLLIENAFTFILTAMRAFPTEDFFEDGVMAIENIVDINPDNANILVDELKNDTDFTYEVMTNNGANLLLYLSEDQCNAVILQLVIKYNNSK